MIEPPQYLLFLPTDGDASVDYFMVSVNRDVRAQLNMMQALVLESPLNLHEVVSGATTVTPVSRSELTEDLQDYLDSTDPHGNFADDRVSFLVLKYASPNDVPVHTFRTRIDYSDVVVRDDGFFVRGHIHNDERETQSLMCWFNDLDRHLRTAITPEGNPFVSRKSEEDDYG